MDLKLCPTCKTFVFEDMDTCYGCMYRFGSDPAREELVHREIVGSDFPENPDSAALVALDEPEEAAPPGRTCRLPDGYPWPPPAEDGERPSAVLRDDASVLSTGEEVPAVKVVVLGDWRILFDEAKSVAGTRALHITIEPATAEAGSGNGGRCVRRA